MILAYTRSGGWSDLDRSQRLFEQGVAGIESENELEPVIFRCRGRYREVINQIQGHFLKLIEEAGWPPEGLLRQTQVFDRFVAPALSSREKVVLVLADSLRFEMGRDLAHSMEELGEVEIQPAAASLPTITPVGMASLMPDADGVLSIREFKGEFMTWLGDQPMGDITSREAYLKEKLGDRVTDVEIGEFLSSTNKVQASLVKDKDLVVVKDSRIDTFGEKITLRDARRYMTDLLGDLKAVARQLAKLGYQKIIISADHGHVLLPSIQAGDIAKGVTNGKWLIDKRRFKLGHQVKENASTIVVNAGLVGIHGDIREIVLPKGFSVFTDGSGYFHGGLSLQEAVIPVITLRASLKQETKPGNDIIEIHYRRDTFTSRVIGLKIWYVSILSFKRRVIIEAYSGTGKNADKVGETAECDARDPITREITLTAGQETPVPLLLDAEFNGEDVQIRVLDPDAPVVLASMNLKNGIID
jgi:hypothetical protein